MTATNEMARKDVKDAERPAARDLGEAAPRPRSRTLLHEALSALDAVLSRLDGKLPAGDREALQDAVARLRVAAGGTMTAAEFRAARIAAGMTQEAVAAFIGRTARQVARYEAGQTGIPAAVAAEVRRLATLPKRG